MTSVGRILQIPDLPFAPEPLRGRNIVAVEVAYTGADDQERIGTELVRTFRDLDPEMDMVATMPAADMVRLHQDPEPPMPGVGGHVMIDEVTPEAMSRFVRLTGPRSGSPFISSEIRHLGGAVGRPSPDGGALSHLDGEGAMFVIGVPMHPEHRELLVRGVTRVETEMARFGHGRLYRNFVEEQASARRFHADDRLARLRDLRRRFDPATQLQTNHPIDREMGEV